MIVLPDSKIYKACSEDDSRPILQTVHYNKEQKRLEAADGFIMALLPVGGDGTDADGIIPASAIKAAYKMANHKGDRATLRVGEDGTVTPGKLDHYDRTEDGAAIPLADGIYPHCEQIEPKVDGEFICALDAKRLFQLAQAICGGEIADFYGVELYRVAGKYSPIIVKPVKPPIDSAHSKGLIMPVRKDEY